MVATKKSKSKKMLEVDFDGDDEIRKGSLRKVRRILYNGERSALHYFLDQESHHERFPPALRNLYERKGQGSEYILHQFNCYHYRNVHNVRKKLGFASVTEWSEEGSLGNLMEVRGKDNPITWEQRFDILEQICMGLQFLHRNQVSHGALSVFSVLLFRWNIKLGHIQHRNHYRNQEWRAPEQGDMTPAGDIYSVGIIMLCLLTGNLERTTWGDSFCHDERHWFNATNRRQQDHYTILMTECLDNNPAHRPPLDVVLKRLKGVRQVTPEIKVLTTFQSPKKISIVKQPEEKRIYNRDLNQVYNRKFTLDETKLTPLPSEMLQKDVIGRSSSIVYRGTYEKDSVAVRVYNIEDNNHNELEYRYILLQHPCVMQMYGFLRSGNDECLVMELAQGRLSELLHDAAWAKKAQMGMTRKRKYRWCRQAAQGIHYLHELYLQPMLSTVHSVLEDSREKEEEKEEEKKQKETGRVAWLICEYAQNPTPRLDKMINTVYQVVEEVLVATLICEYACDYAYHHNLTDKMEDTCHRAIRTSKMLLRVDDSICVTGFAEGRKHNGVYQEVMESRGKNSYVRWYPPEFFDEFFVYSSLPLDVYCFAVTVFSILTRSIPLHGSGECNIRRRIESGPNLYNLLLEFYHQHRQYWRNTLNIQPWEEPESFDEGTISLLTRSLDRNIMTRPDIRQWCEHFEALENSE